MSPNGNDLERLGAGTLLEIRKEAAAWLVEMDMEPEHWDRHGFTAWLKSSPQHMQEFLEQTSLWVSLREMEPARLDIPELLRNSSSVVDWPQGEERQQQTQRVQSAPAPRSPRSPRRRRWMLPSAAAVLLLAAGAGWLFQRGAVSRVLTTDIGEQRVVKLSDHSVVHMNTHSRVEVHFTDTLREIRLIDGEASFTVARDASRPFKVYANGVEVEAIGTQFNVRRRATETVVAVVEGRVAVATAAERSNTAAKSIEQGTARSNATSEPGASGEQARAVLGAGEQVRVTANGVFARQSVENTTAATAWWERRLVFRQTPFSEVAEEVARYNVTPRLHFEGDALRARRLDGVFAADDPETLIQFLAQDPALSVVRRADDVIIRERQSSTNHGSQ